MKRFFIGLPVDKRSQGLINNLLITVRSFPATIRWVPEENRHLTLAFLGEAPGSDIDRLKAAFDASFSGQQCFRFQMPTLERFPNPEGRIIALTGRAVEPLHGLVGITRKLLETHGIEFDRKKFKPHVTVGRIKKIKHPPPPFERQADIALDISSVVLYQSTLTDAGSVYTKIKVTKLAQ